MKDVYVGKRSAILAHLKVILIPTENKYIITDGLNSTDFATERELRRAIFELRTIDQNIKVHWLPAPGIEGIGDFVWVVIRALIIPVTAMLILSLVLAHVWRV